MFPETDPFEMYVVIEAIVHQYNVIHTNWPLANSMMPLVPSTHIYQKLPHFDAKEIFWCIDWLAYHNYLKVSWKSSYDGQGVERWISTVHM
jgi:hypothetical protein